MNEINLEKLSDIVCKISIDNEFIVLKGSFEGEYRDGSAGNSDGNFIFASIASTYFLYETISAIVLDFQKLNYAFGNTLLKSLNFFLEIGRDGYEKNKKIIIVVAEENKIAIESLVTKLKHNNCSICFDPSQALEIAKVEARKYLS